MSGPQVGWTIRGPDGWTVDTIYYTEDCDEAYIRRAEDIPEDCALKREDR